LDIVVNGSLQIAEDEHPMMNNNKILTVSYGTFSCTLEGFEDSFGTMKAIAEYFRDLAADDRYFGAEPPQPDAEMLARIAQKEMTRKVQARQQDGTIVLSALEDHTEIEPTPAEAPTAASDAPAKAETAQPATLTVSPKQAAPVEIKTPSDAPIAAAATVSVEQPKVSIPTVQEPVQQPVAEPAPAPETEAKAETIAKNEMPEDTAAPVARAVEEDENDIVPGQPDKDVEAFFADAAPAAPQKTETQPEVAKAPAPSASTPAPDSIAAKLQRIRAVVAQHEEEEEDDDYLEDELPADAAREATKRREAVDQARTEIEQAMAADEAASAKADAETKAQEPSDADEITAILDALAKGDIENDTGTTKDKGEDTVNNIFEDAETTLASKFAAKQPVAKVAKVVTQQTQVVSVGRPQTQKPTQPQARVIKVKRKDLETAIEKGDLEEYDEQETAPKAAPKAEDAPKAAPGLDDLAPARTGKTALSPEDEADLARELAELEADITATAKPKKERTAGAARELLPSIDQGEGADVNRLLAETDHQMDEPESATRRDAFAHLRAAVAAKKADATINDGSKPDGDNDYRNDLAEVVRPRRPVSTSARTERPEEPRPAPLKLVAEQRIDGKKPVSADPVRPRRVSARAEKPAVAHDGDSFADYVADVGATSLPQLLEAAAAYMAFVEGQEQFSRPQLMTKVRQASGDDGFSREEGLRSFGQLLRSGKIEKIKGGRFTVSDDIGFRPDERAAS
jgi:pilus assembly protein FimV